MAVAIFRALLVHFACVHAAACVASAAQLSSSFLKAKEAAEAKGYKFLTRAEILAGAKKERQLRVLYGVHPAAAERK
jgi:hypothetical protein